MTTTTASSNTEFPTDAELDVRVARGARLLDRHQPGWPDTVWLEALDVSDTQFCVAAQVIGNSSGDDAYMDAMDKLRLNDPTSREECGFTLGMHDVGILSYRLNSHERTAIYAPLTNAWKRLITARLTEATA